MTGTSNVEEVLHNFMQRIANSEHVKNPLIVVIGYNKYIFPDFRAVDNSSPANFWIKHHCRFNIKDVSLVTKYNQEFVEFEEQMINFFDSRKIKNKYGFQSFDYLPLINIPLDDEFLASLSSRKGSIYQSYVSKKRCDFLFYIVFGFGFKYGGCTHVSNDDLLCDNNFHFVELRKLFSSPSLAVQISFEYLVRLDFGVKWSTAAKFNCGEMTVTKRYSKLSSIQLLWTGDPRHNPHRIKQSGGKLLYRNSKNTKIVTMQWEIYDSYAPVDLVLIEDHHYSYNNDAEIMQWEVGKSYVTGDLAIIKGQKWCACV